MVYERVWHESDPEKFGAAIDELVSKDCVVIGLPRGENIARAGFRQFRMMFFRSLSHAAIERRRSEPSIGVVEIKSNRHESIDERAAIE